MLCLYALLLLPNEYLMRASSILVVQASRSCMSLRSHSRVALGCLSRFLVPLWLRLYSLGNYIERYSLTSIILERLILLVRYWLPIGAFLFYLNHWSG